MDVIQLISDCIDSIPAFQFLALGDNVRQFSTSMLPQIDMTKETTSLENFSANLSKPSSRKHLRRLGCRVIVPKVYKHLSHPNLLVESYEEGMLLGQWMRLTQKQDRSINMEPGAKEGAKKEDRDEWNTKGYFLRYLEDIPERTDLRTDPLSVRPTILSDLKLRLPHLFETARVVMCDQINNIRNGCRELVTRFCHKLGIQYDAPDPRLEPGYGENAYWPRVAHAGLATLLQMIFVDNFVHGDLHPGNIIIRFRKRDSETESGENGDHELKNSEEGENGRYASKWKSRFINLKQFFIHKLSKPVLAPEKLSSKSNLNDPSLLTRKQLESHFNRRCDHDGDDLSAVFTGDFKDVDFEMVLLDCGITTSLSIREYCNFTDLLRCICLGDGYTAGEY